MAARKKYSREFKQDAVRLVIEQGYNHAYPVSPYSPNGATLTTSSCTRTRSCSIGRIATSKEYS
jgi:hypothetical protein